MDMRKAFLCKECGHKITEQEMLKNIRPGGYMFHSIVRDKIPGIEFPIEETSINPEMMEYLSRIELVIQRTSLNRLGVQIICTPSAPIYP
jgi:hypothetical protein